jgi:hypothetical protein
VIRRARALLQHITKRIDFEPVPEPTARADEQSQLFSQTDMLVDEILGVDVNRLTPLEALELLARWQDAFKDSQRGGG